MDHKRHHPGTVNHCAECLEVAYEPSWYALLMAFVEEQPVAVLDGQVRAQT